MKVQRKRNIVCSMILSGGMMFAIPAMMRLTDDELYMTNSIFSMIGWIALTYIFSKILAEITWNDVRENILEGILAIAFGGTMALGSDLDSSTYIVLGDVRRIINVFIFTPGLLVLMKGTWQTLRCDSPREEPLDKETDCYSGKELFGVFVLFIICWLPVLLASYPGFFVYDAQDEVNEVLTRNFTRGCKKSCV